MSHCKACNAPLPLGYVDEAETIEEDVCRTCRRKTWQALRMEQHEFEGLWWDHNWTGIEFHVSEHKANS